jgi:ubiquinone/menaquinone biosynthesis C-methylase UbiE
MSSITGDARFWDRIARKYAADRIADVAGYERTLERTRHYLNGEDVALEFGCGTGTTALKLAASVTRYVATDISTEMIAIAREKANAEGCRNAEFEVATPETTNWADATFDVAMAFNLLHLVAAREAALQGIHRLLKPAGSSSPRPRVSRT